MKPISTDPAPIRVTLPKGCYLLLTPVEYRAGPKRSEGG